MNKVLEIVGIAALTYGCAMGAYAQQAKPMPSNVAAIKMDRYQGGSVKVPLVSNIVLNKSSTLEREWFVIRDENAPAYLSRATGVDVEYQSGQKYSSGHYAYRAFYQVTPKEPITAFEIRILVFDVFGKLVRTLSTTRIVDAEAEVRDDSEWRLWSEAEASEVFGSISYIAQVRTASGRVYEADRIAILDQARKVTKRLTESDLEPKREGAAKQQ